MAIDPFNIVIWHAFWFFLSWHLYFLSQGDEKGQQETHAHLYQYIISDWGTLQEEHTIRTMV
jgi:hypothetical protein